MRVPRPLPCHIVVVDDVLFVFALVVAFHDELLNLDFDHFRSLETS